VLVVLVAWTTFAFAGVYPAELSVALLLAVALTVIERPGVPRSTVLDRAALVLLAAAAIQLVPLPAPVVDTLSPHARAVWSRLSLRPPAAIPLSIDLRAGVWALAVGAMAVLAFVTARALFETGGVRVVVRGIATIGLIVSGIAIAQDATAHGLMYWRWAPLQEGAPPFGPFVNRDHFATWAIMAAPLVAGYLAAHSAAHHRAGGALPWRRRLTTVLDGRAIWLTASLALLAIGLVTTLSRSGFFGMGIALMCGAALGARRRDAGGRISPGVWMAAAVGVVIVLAISRVDPVALVHRVSAAGRSAADRAVIWRDTLPLIRDFWLTGTGAGTYETAMLVYQRAQVGARFNQAHNQYLQLAAEGGLLLGVPLAVAIAAFARRAHRALVSDDSGMYWIRAGALSGLAGVAAQGLFETGLTTPANALLAAVCAAVVIHAPAHGRSGS
jgi:O-antigen ligase